MGGMTTFENNDSVYSHGEDSISKLNRLAEIAKEAYKYIPENDCTVACGTFVDVDIRAFLSAVQHFRESIEAYRDITEELDDDIREMRSKLEKERDQSTQLEELKRKLNEKYGTVVACMELEDKLDRKCREVGELTSVVANLQNELDHVYEKIELIKADRDRYFKQLYESGYFDTDIAHMYPKTTLNNPQNFCGNCKHFVTHPCDIATCNNKYASQIIVDPDDASCEHFKPTYDTRVVIGKPEFPVCEKCNREDCDNCTLCPF